MSDPVQDAAGQKAVVTLELRERGGGIGAEHPILLARVVTQLLEPLLQCEDSLALVPFSEFQRETGSA